MTIVNITHNSDIDIHNGHTFNLIYVPTISKRCGYEYIMFPIAGYIESYRDIACNVEQGQTKLLTGVQL